MLIRFAWETEAFFIQVYEEHQPSNFLNESKSRTGYESKYERERDGERGDKGGICVTRIG